MQWQIENDRDASVPTVTERRNENREAFVLPLKGRRRQRCSFFTATDRGRYRGFHAYADRLTLTERFPFLQWQTDNEKIKFRLTVKDRRLQIGFRSSIWTDDDRDSFVLTVSDRRHRAASVLPLTETGRRRHKGFHFYNDKKTEKERHPIFHIDRRRQRSCHSCLDRLTLTERFSFLQWQTDDDRGISVLPLTDRRRQKGFYFCDENRRQ
jgi:hypothetical protein